MNCKNCNHLLTEENKFCSSCGAKVMHNRLTINNLFSQFMAEFLSYDNKIVKTYKNLFTQPEDVVGGYISGVRKRYVNVVNYFAIAITLTGVFFFFFLDNYSAALDQMSALQDQTEVQAELNRKVNRFTLEYQSIIFFVFVPFFALISRVLFLQNKKYNYTEHIVMNMYAQAQMSITSILMYTLTVWWGQVFQVALMVFLPVQMLYFAYLFKRMYGLTLLQTVGKTLLFLAILVPVVFGTSILVAIILFATGVIDANEFLEAERARREATSYIVSSAINWTS